MDKFNKMERCKRCKVYRDISQLNKEKICITCRQKNQKRRIIKTIGSG